MTPETQHSVFCEPEWADECRRCAHLSMSRDGKWWKCRVAGRGLWCADARQFGGVCGPDGKAFQPLIGSKKQ